MISKMLAQKIDAKLINADEIVKLMAKPGNEYYKKQIELFGKNIIFEGLLNKKKIADIIYNNLDKREKLDKLTFQYVVNEIKNQINQETAKNIIIDAPLLFESGLNNICQFTVGVIAKKEIKVNRICKRDKIDKKTAMLRLNIQKDDSFYRSKVNYIIENNGNINEINLEELCTIIGKN